KPCAWARAMMSVVVDGTRRVNVLTSVISDRGQTLRCAELALREERRLVMTTAVSNPNQALWEKGDFTRIADTMRGSGEALVQRIGIRKGQKVLDLGCGDGTTAIPAAKQGADVVGVDIARNLVEAGNRRAAKLGLANCTFREGDATNLRPLADQS